MKAKSRTKTKAIELRLQGLTYTEIQRQVPVSTATLSNCLHQVKLNQEQTKRIVSLQARKRQEGATLRKQDRLKRTEQTMNQAAQMISRLTIREMLLIGTALYWAEGSKQNSKSVSQGLIFSNSDPKMIALYYQWLISVFHVDQSQITIELYLHENKILRKKAIVQYWAQRLSLPEIKFDRIYIKRHTTSRPSSDREYYGLVRVVVKRSTNLNKQVAGWIHGICKQCGIV